MKLPDKKKTNKLNDLQKKRKAKRKTQNIKDIKGMEGKAGRGENGDSNNTSVSNSVNTSVSDNTTDNTTTKKADITIKKRDQENHSNYRENLYLNKEIQDKLNSISEQTGYSKSELARLAFNHLFDNLEIK